MSVVRDNPSFQPLYRQIKDLLMHALEQGEWKPGEPIPSELDLAARFQVSQGTVRKAIDELAAENILVRRQGKGTFVATHTEEDHSQFRFLRIRRTDGVDEYPASRLLDVWRTKATTEAARLLDLKTGDTIIKIKRVLEFAGKPAVLDEITLPASLFKGLTKARCECFVGSMYGFFEAEFGVRMLRAEERITAVAADGPTAMILNVPVGEPLLAVERVAFTYGGRPVEWRRGLCATRQQYYFNELG